MSASLPPKPRHIADLKKIIFVINEGQSSTFYKKTQANVTWPTCPKESRREGRKDRCLLLPSASYCI
ncbi:hypothetical protein PFLUV_G00081440 [Perca fluviatilis]|uniref:Uncharacterized protein n=1 Tax=Perca fluviatilis TaxID=8168 RepID=A0A6A5F2X3_PERFL|nr:hypothetical protein PFLUV_G00081440 [Perca fluviatilis]